MLFRHIQHPSQADLSAYVDGELAVVQARSVAAHAEACAECRQVLEGLQETKVLLAGLARAMLPRSFALSATQAGLQPVRPTTPRPTAMRFAPAVSLAALAILLVVDVSLPSGGGDSSATSNEFRPGLIAKSSVDSADSVSGATLQAPGAAAIAPSPLPRAANSDAGVVGATGPAAAPPPAVAPSAAAQAAPSGQSAMQAEAQAPLVPAQPESRSGAPEPVPPVAIQPFAATPGSDAGGAAAAAPAATTGGVAPGPSQPQQPSVTAPEDDSEDNDRTVLRVFEVLAAAAFFASLLVVFWPRLTRKEP